MLSKIQRWNNTLVGPYPGRTWEQEAALKKHALFGYGIPAKINPHRCDLCNKPSSTDYTFCSKACFKRAQAEAKADRVWEAKVS